MAKNTKFVTAKGVAMYPYLQPGQPDTAFSTEGTYRVKLRLNPDDAKPLLGLIETAAKDRFGDKASKVRRPFETDQDTGELIFTVKSKYQPAVVDGQGNAIPETKVPQIFGGSVLKASGTIYAYDNGGNRGVSLQLGAVQIVELAERQGGAAFEAVEGGWTPPSGSDTDSGEANYGF